MSASLGPGDHPMSSETTIRGHTTVTEQVEVMSQCYEPLTTLTHEDALMEPLLNASPSAQSGEGRTAGSCFVIFRTHHKTGDSRTAKGSGHTGKVIGTIQT